MCQIRPCTEIDASLSGAYTLCFGLSFRVAKNFFIANGERITFEMTALKHITVANVYYQLGQ